MRKVSLQDKLLSMLYNVNPNVERKRARPGAITLEAIAKHVALKTACSTQAKHFDECDDDVVSVLDTNRASDDAELLSTTGEVAHVVMSGGSHTRLNKSLLDVLPNAGVSLASHTNMQSHPNIETWVMVSPTTFKAWTSYLSVLVPTPYCTVFEQFESYALDPMFNLVSNGVGLRPSGTGDVFSALVESGLLSDNPKAKHIMISYGNNIIPAPDMCMLQRHLATGSLVTCEVTKACPADKTVSPDAPFLAWHGGGLALLAHEHMPNDGVSRWRATGTMIVDRSVLLSQQAQQLDAYELVRKNVKKNIVFQLERNAWELVNTFPTSFVSGQCHHVWSPETWDDADFMLRNK